MSKNFSLFLGSALLSIVLLLGGCSDFDEMKSQRALIQAEVLLEKGQEEDAVSALTELIERFPSTQSREVAQRHLIRIEKQRERRERMAFAKVLDSYRQVLNGYQSIYAEYPKSAASLDESGYFFDVAYLEEVTPENYRVYLWLKSDGSGFRVWCTIDGKEKGYSVESGSVRLSPLVQQKTLEELRSNFDAADWNARLVVLEPKA